MEATTFLTFEEWLKKYPELRTDCKECSDGKVECSECGQDRDCDMCGGTGLDASVQLTYKRQLARDKILLSLHQRDNEVASGAVA